MVKNPPATAGVAGSILGSGKSHGQRSLADYSPWGCKESDTTKHACTAGGQRIEDKIN